MALKSIISRAAAQKPPLQVPASNVPAGSDRRSRVSSCERPADQVISRRDLNAGIAMTALAAWQMMAPAAQARESAIVEVMKGAEGERDLLMTATGIKYTELTSGKGDKPRTGDLVMVDLVGRTEDGEVFLDTKAAGTPLAFQMGQTNKYVPEGLMQTVESMKGGDVRLAVVPASLGYGASGMKLAQGSVPPNAKLYYEVELLRCQTFTIGLACCSDASFPCIKNQGDLPEGAQEVAAP